MMTFEENMAAAERHQAKAAHWLSELERITKEGGIAPPVGVAYATAANAHATLALSHRTRAGRRTVES